VDNAGCGVNRLEKLIASLFYSGYFPIFPATVGSAVTCVAYWFLVPQNIFIQALLIFIIFFLGVFLSSRLVKEWGPDPKRVVIDETCGMLVSLFMIPKSLFLVLAAFLLFRFFDIVKPFPVRRSQVLKSGWGIVVDDLLAGIYTRVVMFIICFFWGRIV
jgi:phosphatidylglycerophosphatase A